MRLPKGLYAIADNGFSGRRAPSELAKAYLEGGCRLIQLRMKGCEVSLFSREAEKILQFKKEYSFTFILNDHVKMAKELGADGVHIGAHDMKIAEARAILGADKMIGYSSHGLGEALQAEKEGADYVAFGAIFPTRTKGPGHPVQGLGKLRQTVKALNIPVVAIGGITETNIADVRETGVHAYAMITALTEAENIAAATRDFL